MSTDEVMIVRNAARLEVCILLAGAKRGIFLPADVLKWLQSEAISWTVTGDRDKITFTIPDEIERTLFSIRFAHMRSGPST